MTLYKVCNIDDLKNGLMRLLRINNKEIVIAKYKQKIIAFDPLCPHRYAYLHTGWFKDNKIVCPLHEFEFDLDNGKVVNIPEKYYTQRDEWKKSNDIRFYNIIIIDGSIYIDI